MDELIPIVILETPRFLSRASKILSEEERTALVDYLAYNPEAGDLIQGTGGVRKLRWKLQGRGKSGGARIIYFYYNPAFPIFALSAYAKNERTDLTQAEKNELKDITKLIIETYRLKKGH